LAFFPLVPAGFVVLRVESIVVASAATARSVR
jgi:hypothetical protein